MRTGRDTEYIVTEFVTPTTQNAYILVAIQSCKFTNPMDELLGEEEEAKEWSNEYENTEKNYHLHALHDWAALAEKHLVVLVFFTRHLAINFSSAIQIHQIL